MTSYRHDDTFWLLVVGGLSTLYEIVKMNSDDTMNDMMALAMKRFSEVCVKTLNQKFTTDMTGEMVLDKLKELQPETLMQWVCDDLKIPHQSRERAYQTPGLSNPKKAVGLKEIVLKPSAPPVVLVKSKQKPSAGVGSVMQEKAGAEEEDKEITEFDEDVSTIGKQSGLKVPARKLKKVILDTEKNHAKRVKDLFPLPYLPHCIDYSSTCQGIVFNYGLLTPCLTHPINGELFCRRCMKTKRPYGTVRDREEHLREHPHTIYVTPNKSFHEIKYGTFLKMYGLTIEQAKEAILKNLNSEDAVQITFPDDTLNVDEHELANVKIPLSLDKKTGRPAKSGSAPPPKKIGPDESLEEDLDDLTEIAMNGCKTKLSGANKALLEQLMFEREEEYNEEEEEILEKGCEAMHIDPKKMDGNYIYDDDTLPDEIQFTMFTYKGYAYIYQESDYLLYEYDPETDTIGKLKGRWDADDETPCFIRGLHESDDDKSIECSEEEEEVEDE